ncbi:dTDP-4-dehydrorhamnose reductase [Gordonia sp. (in: high G+C Gram-positive bacteria)]|uniref:dTDP-4-dehydrorhamnose reductase n=1 Tax=Gordonia sp. (in: high G+C Gram-positive bacteria) TaxID=84139 RepID=UPI002630BE63|nr:dTDP-4-dehydrorhamnose reductase [Gordonia sp. (in: high G+C Gram-positive bacteria)]
MSQRTVHLIGASGQLGTALRATAPAGVVAAPYTSDDIDLIRRLSVRDALAGLRSGDVVVNAAAYTAVDDAETDWDLAFRVNAHGPALLAEATAAAGARLVHLSTDYVFSAPPGWTVPLEPGDLDPEAEPESIYGASKLAGERAARAADPSSTVVRTAWVYTGGPDSPDFVGTMRRLEAGRPEISVVDDQRGSPTYVSDLARGLWELVGHVGAPGDITAGADLHATGAGEATWFQLAQAVFAGLGADPGRVLPCTTDQFPRPAPRPAFSVLSGRSWAQAGLTPLRDWREALTEALESR